ncbi:hypothetical protein LTS17_009596 [Exophiala oligosperma]
MRDTFQDIFHGNFSSGVESQYVLDVFEEFDQGDPPRASQDEFFLDYESFLPSNEGQQDQWQQGSPVTHDSQDWTDAFAATVPRRSPPPGEYLVSENNDQDVALSGSSEALTSHARSGSTFQSLEASDTQDAGSAGDDSVIADKAPTTFRRPRKQNQSCDQCRHGKRACTLPRDITIQMQKPLAPCSTCKVRGLECTATWLESKRSMQASRKRSRKSTSLCETTQTTDDLASRSKPTKSTTGALHVGMVASLSASNVDLTRQFSAREMCAQYLNLHIDVCDMPMAHSLLQGSMPARYSSGLAALTPLCCPVSMCPYMERAEEWTRSCWNIDFDSRTLASVGPRLFRTVGVLDSIFEHRSAGSCSASMAARDASINEAYKWVAAATATQFAIAGNASNHGRETPAKVPRSKIRDIAYTTWLTARQVLFENISAMGSFRLALSLFLFALVQPPDVGNRRVKFNEDVKYAFCEGNRRLETLCSQARLCLRYGEDSSMHFCHWNVRKSVQGSDPAHSLSSDVKENISELIGAVEWLVTMTNAMQIVISNGAIGRLPGLPHSDHSSPEFGCDDNVQEEDMDVLQVTRPCEEGIQDPAVDDHQGEDLTTLCKKGALEESMLKTMRRSAFIVILLWKTLAHLVVATDTVDARDLDCTKVRKIYTSAVTLIRLWRSTFGPFDSSTVMSFRTLQPGTRVAIAYCLNDGDLGVLYFYDIAQRLKAKLAVSPRSSTMEALAEELRSTSTFRTKERIASATQISHQSSGSKDTFSPGFEGTQGLKAHIQDIAAHPCPALVVQAHKLAAKAFADDLHPLIARKDWNRGSRMIEGFHTCMDGLQELQQTLVTLPDWSDDEND